MAPTSGYGLQNCHTRWCLHWCVSNVETNAVGFYTAPWVTNPPYLLVFTLAYRLQNHHTHWHLHWYVTNAQVNAVGSYIRMWITHLPYSLVFTLVYEQCRCQYS